MNVHTSNIARLRRLIRHDTDDCIEWTGRRNPTTGYGQWSDRGQTAEYAHRWACYFGHGYPPDDERTFALHSCHNRPCVNPAHLRWGTQAENVKDRQAHGAWHAAMAARATWRILNADQVSYARWWRIGGCSFQNLGEMFNVSPETVAAAVGREES